MIVLTYNCSDCDLTWDITCESGEADPDCPRCSQVLTWLPRSFSIGGSVTSKAVDLTQQVLEKDYGVTDIGDRQREGDIAHKDKPMHTGERDQIEREVRQYVSAQDLHPMTKGFYGGTTASAPAGIVQNALADFKMQSAHDRDPVGKAQAAIKESGDTTTRVIPMFKG